MFRKADALLVRWIEASEKEVKTMSETEPVARKCPVCHHPWDAHLQLYNVAPWCNGEESCRCEGAEWRPIIADLEARLAEAVRLLTMEHVAGPSRYDHDLKKYRCVLCEFLISEKEVRP